MQRPRYQHRQVSWIGWLAALAALAGFTIAWAWRPGFPPAAWLVAPFVLVLLAAFSSLTIAVDREELRWHFGPGVWRKRIALADIEAVEVTRTRFWNGWGIHLTSRGWLYNVAGCDAVLVRRRDGKAILLGTDEPRRLAAALQRALDRQRPSA